MWVYEPKALPAGGPETEPTETVLLPAVIADEAEVSDAEHVLETAPIDSVAPQKPTPAAASKTSERKAFPAADCALLAGAFLLGSAAAGILCALCDAQHLEWMSYYLEQWPQLFAVTGTRSAAALFAVQYFTLLAAATVLLVLGFSAFGPTLIFLFVMLYGVGNGLLTLQLLPGTSWSKKALVFVLTALPASAASVCLCLLGAAALRVSGQLRAYSFWPGRVGIDRPRAVVLFRQYLLTLVLLLPLCGAATGLACLESRLL